MMAITTDGQHPEYAIRVVEDFLAVPDDRLDDCLAEFANTVRAARATKAAILAAMEQEGIPLSGGLVALGSWRWIDDGERAIRVEFAPVEYRVRRDVP